MSLTQVTTSLVSTKSSVSFLVYLRVLDSLRNEAGEAFLQAHKEAKRITEDQPRKTGLVLGQRWKGRGRNDGV